MRAYFQLLRKASPFDWGFFGPLGTKSAYYAVGPILGHNWCSVATLVTFSSDISNLKKKPKNPFF